MMLSLHILSAVISIIFTTYLLFEPTKRLMPAHYALVVFTLASGTYLIFNAQGHLMETCIMGVAYIVFASWGTISLRSRLALFSES